MQYLISISSGVLGIIFLAFPFLDSSRYITGKGFSLFLGFFLIIFTIYYIFTSDSTTTKVVTPYIFWMLILAVLTSFVFGMVDFEITWPFGVLGVVVLILFLGGYLKRAKDTKKKESYLSTSAQREIPLQTNKHRNIIIRPLLFGVLVWVSVFIFGKTLCINISNSESCAYVSFLFAPMFGIGAAFVGLVASFFLWLFKKK